MICSSCFSPIIFQDGRSIYLFVSIIYAAKISSFMDMNNFLPSFYSANHKLWCDVTRVHSWKATHLYTDSQKSGWRFTDSSMGDFKEVTLEGLHPTWMMTPPGCVVSIPRCPPTYQRTHSIMAELKIICWEQWLDTQVRVPWLLFQERISTVNIASFWWALVRRFIQIPGDGDSFILRIILYNSSLLSWAGKMVEQVTTTFSTSLQVPPVLSMHSYWPFSCKRQARQNSSISFHN